MHNYLTPEETAQQLKVDVTEILSLIEQGKLGAIRVGANIRIPEPELEKLPITCAAGPTGMDAAAPTAEMPPGNSRWCHTRTGRAKFRVSGSVNDGAEIWPGRMRYPIKFPKSFMEAMLAHFGEGEIAVGGSFDRPLPGSLGEFVQQRLKIKMNPAVYLAALLIDEGYAEASSHRGYIRFCRRWRKPASGQRR
jgi:excisionase family DNA binding protein